jgi:endonuclease I
MRRGVKLAAYWLLLLAAVWAPASLRGDAYDPPANYYGTATGTGATLKSQLNDVIDNHTVVSYDAARTALQITDADPAHASGYMLTVYDRTSVNVAAINPGGPVPGWDNAATWNREHVWPRSRGIDSSGPDDSDLFNLRPALTINNGDRGNLNFGAVFGTPWGVVTDKGSSKWSPGAADAGMIARQAFYMAVRYDGTDGSTTNLELFANNPSTSQGLGDLDRLIEWHFAAPPDSFERRRNQIIYDNYQHNRDPFIDNPEMVWTVFVDQANDSQITIGGGAAGAAGASTLTVDLGRRLVGAALPAPQNVTLNKAGLDGTYFRVTAAGAATSSLSGKFNAFLTGAIDSKTLAVGVSGSTAAAGLKTGTVTIDNLDLTSGGGSGRGATDGNDVITANLSILDHANPSFSLASDVNSLSLDFGTVTLGSSVTGLSFSLANLAATAGFTAGLDLDSIVGNGDTARLATNLATFGGASPLAATQSMSFQATLDSSTLGAFSASYTLNFSDENLVGAAALGSLTLNLTGQVAAASSTGDFNGDGVVDGSDLLAWQGGFGVNAGATTEEGDADGNGAVDADDLAVWQQQFAGATPAVASVPEPATLLFWPTLAWLGGARRRRRSA